MPVCPINAMQRFGALDQRLRARFTRRNGDLRLPKPVRSAILPAKTPGIRRMSVNEDEPARKGGCRENAK